MTDHLSLITLTALADGELSRDQLASANEHLAECPACTSSALAQSLLKAAIARGGRRYSLPPHLQERLKRQVDLQRPGVVAPRAEIAEASSFWSPGRLGIVGWVTAFALLLVVMNVALMQRIEHRFAPASESAALVTEVRDQHIATLTANSAPEVLSSDRHTVKPWFQGKIPFSFNLPEDLPSDTTLEGANLTYLHGRPAAQLLYSIGKHRVSVFVGERTGETTSMPAEHSGFHVDGFTTPDLEAIAVSDVDPARLADLVSRIKEAQTASRGTGSQGAP